MDALYPAGPRPTPTTQADNGPPDTTCKPGITQRRIDELLRILEIAVARRRRLALEARRKSDRAELQ